MELLTPTAEQGELGVRALWTVATIDGAVTPEEHGVLRGARSFAGVGPDVTPTAISPEALAQALPEDPRLRRQLLCGLSLMAMADGLPTDQEYEIVDAFARALGADHDILGTLRKMAHDHLVLARFDIYRRFWARGRVEAKIKEEGLVGLAETIRTLQRKRSDPELTARYRALGDLPVGTLGRAYYEFISSNAFSFPGELGHGPEFIAIHDMAHVLGGYGTTPTEEMGVAFFSAGFRREDPMAFVLLGIFQLHLGIATMPGQPVSTGALDMRVALEALRRGAAMNTDISAEDWNLWPFVARPLDELRAELGVPPRRER